MFRQKIQSASATATVLIALLVATQWLCIAARAADDPLPSWNEGTAKQQILTFVKTTTTEGSTGFVPPQERIATFDQDGTLWVEQPAYAQAQFAFDRIKAMASAHPEWKTEQPYAAIISGDKAEIEKLTMQDIMQIFAETQTGMTLEAFNAIIKDWLATARQPRFKRPPTELTYQPMLEVMQYLRANGYQTYICTGGGQEFVRVFSEKTYGVQPQQVIGSVLLTEYGYAADGKSQLTKIPKIVLVNDNAKKPVAINMFIGRRPYASFGNSTGDKEMLEWTQSGGGTRLMMLVHHDDAEREYAYGPESKVGTFSDALMAEANKRGWVVISMKNDWKRVFAW